MKLIEIARSYTRKINLGNYESLDVFCSAKEEVPKKEAEKTSERLFKFCKKEVIKSVDEYRSKQIEDLPAKEPQGTFTLTDKQKETVKKATTELEKPSVEKLKF